MDAYSVPPGSSIPRPTPRCSSVQKLLGHSDPKITERRYGHLLPEFMSAEVNRLQFGLGCLLPAGISSQRVAAVDLPRVTPELQLPAQNVNEAGAPQISLGDSGLLDGGVYGTRTRTKRPLSSLVERSRAGSMVLFR
jgi:hypothetical protein